MRREAIIACCKKYSRGEHQQAIPGIHTRLQEKLTYIFDPAWEKDPENVPYEILTQIMDCYYCLPERPDLAALFCWQAINCSYNELQLGDKSVKDQLQDAKGIDLLLAKIHSNDSLYRDYFDPYIKALPEKAYRFVAAYILKGYVIKNACGDFKGNLKYANQSFKRFCSTYPDLYGAICDSYGKAYLDNSNPRLEGHRIRMHTDENKKGVKLSDAEQKRKANKNRQIIHSLAERLRELVVHHATQIEVKDDKNRTSVRKLTFTEQDALVFIIRFVMYASRCNNFHGNVASRLNSETVNQDTFRIYTTLFLLEYTLLEVSLHALGYLSEDSLKKLKDNEQLLF